MPFESSPGCRLKFEPYRCEHDLDDVPVVFFIPAAAQWAGRVSELRESVAQVRTAGGRRPGVSFLDVGASDMIRNLVFA